MPKKPVKLAWTPELRKQAAKTEAGLRKAMAGRKLRQKPAPKPKPPKVDQKERAVDSLKKLSQIVERCLVALGEIKLPEQQEAPNKPEQHESVQAVKGQVPRI